MPLLRLLLWPALRRFHAPDLPTLEYCCCGLALGKGAVLVSIYQAVSQLGQISLQAVSLYTLLPEAIYGSPDYWGLAEVSFTCLISVLEFFLSWLLLYAVIKKRTRLLEIWLRVEWVAEGIHLSIVSVLIFALVLGRPIRAIEQEVIDSVLDVYCNLVVYSHYRQLTDSPPSEIPTV